MIRRRALAAGIATKIVNHSFRAAGITAYLKNGGRHCHAASGLRSRWRFCSQGDEVSVVRVFGTGGGLK
jgi:hypothetical protein